MSDRSFAKRLNVSRRIALSQDRTVALLDEGFSLEKVAEEFNNQCGKPSRYNARDIETIERMSEDCSSGVLITNKRTIELLNSQTLGEAIRNSLS